MDGTFDVVWSNQFEPSTKRQHASDVYVARWGAEGHCNEDINEVLCSSHKFADVLGKKAHVLVGGFPCQDYSVAKSASSAAGIEGKKGVLWWSIHETLRRHIEAGQAVNHVILENVDRLLKSPTKCRGRDFSIILASLGQLGYAVEWQVVNAADYGFAQRRRRVFIVAHHESTAAYTRLLKAQTSRVLELGALKATVLFRALPWEATASGATFRLPADPLEVQSAYQAKADGSTHFETAGVYIEGMVTTVHAAAVPCSSGASSCSTQRTLGDVVRATPAGSLAPEYYLADEDMAKWAFHKGGKSLTRTSASGHSYTYSEGPMAFPDPLDRPARTIITAEGGRAPSRFKHVVRAEDGRLRRLVPEELEALNGFPRGFTELHGVSPTKRAFFMGNALVTGVVRRIGKALVDAA